MGSDEETQLTSVQSRQYSALRSDLSAALNAFDRAYDWADLIHDLQRVNRVLNKHANSTFLPDKHLLAKRLAQCLTSSLPSGVHLKALETYHNVFTRIGHARLATDLPIYAGGLFPLLSYCSTSLKAPLLSLYETHFLPLGIALRSVLDGFVLAILPGLEDETSEFYIRSRTLMDNVADGVGYVDGFFTSVWRALLLSPPVRFAASHYIRSKLADGDDNLRAHVVSDMPLVAYAITAALSDSDSLTQRNVLDLLLGELALDSPFFRVERPDQRDAAIALVGGVFGTLLRKDISLTKRVHAWFLGGKDKDVAIDFCNKFSKHLVLAAVDNETNVSLDVLRIDEVRASIRPCKIAVALMDRPELCLSLGHHIALRMLDFGRLAIARGHKHASEISNAVAELLQDFGSARTFEELERILVSEKETTYEDFELLSFSLSMFPTKDQIVRKKHLPALLQVAVRSLNDVSTDALILDKAVGFCSKAVLSMGLIKDGDVDEALRDEINRTVSVFASFFVAWLAHAVQGSRPELRREYADVAVTDEYAAEMHMATVWEDRKEIIDIAKSACAFFVTVATAKIGGVDTASIALHATAKCASAADIRVSLAGAKAFADVSAYADASMISASERSEQLFGVIRRCWRQLHPSLQSATAQSAQTLLTLQRRYPEEVKIVIADGILSPILSRRLRNLERFACLWRLAVEHRLLPLPADNGLFLMLDALTDEHWGPKMLARSWLSDALEVDPASIIDAPLRLLLTYESRSVGPEHEFTAIYDAPRALYAFQTLRSILESSPTILGSAGDQNNVSMTSAAVPKKGTGRGRIGVRALAAASPSPRTVQALADVFAVGNVEDSGSNDFRGSEGLSEEGPVVLSQLLPAHNYIVTISLTCLGYLRGRVPERFRGKHDFLKPSTTYNKDSFNETGNGVQTEEDEDFEWVLAGLGSKLISELHESVSAAAAECLGTLLTAIPVPSQMSSVVANLFAEPVLGLIRRTVGVADPVLELHFLNAMTFLITADGPCYLSSIQGKDMFAKARSGRRRISYSETQTQAQTQRRSIQTKRDVQVGAAESLDLFMPWLLTGVASACRGTHTNHDSGSQEVLGVRRRWIQFINTVMKHIGVSIPVVSEGLLLIFCELLNKHDAGTSSHFSVGDSEFSRVDETLVLLEGIAVVISNVLWSFEHALLVGDLKDGAQSSGPEQTLELSTKSLPAMQAKDAVPLNDSESAVNGFEGASAPHTQSASETLSSGSNPLIEKANSVTNTTSAVINALNPLRMINDFVKDVLIGSGSDDTHRLLDPRRSGARALFFLLPSIVTNVAQVWGPSVEIQTESGHLIDDGLEQVGPPRLSTELPRERRQAQRAAVLSIIEPIFELRPIDVIASVVTLYCHEQDVFGALTNSLEDESIARMACHMLHAIDFATPDIVVNCVKVIIEKAVKWENGCTEAIEGRAQATLRQQAQSSIKRLISSDMSSVGDIDVSHIGRMAPNGHSSPLPGGSTGVELEQMPFSTSKGLSSSHQELFYPGDFFAVYSPGLVEIACFNFLDQFFLTCNDGDDTQGSWSSLYPLLRDGVSSVRRKAAIPAILRILGTFISKTPSPIPDRRIRREVMSCASIVINSCGSIAGGQVDISSEEHGNAALFKKRLAIVALCALSTSVPFLMDSAFTDDKTQLTASANLCLSPAVSTLKKASSRAAAIAATSNNAERIHRSTDMSPRREAESLVDLEASEAAANVILNIGHRDWGVKLVRSKILTLIDDTNFFYGKNSGILQKMSAIVRDVVANGGASSLLSSLGLSSSNAPPGIPGLFIGRDSEAVLRARAIRRIAYIVFVSEPDYYSPHLSFVLERIRDVLKMSDLTLVSECLFCLRALLLRTGPSSILVFRATILSEMFRILSKPFDDLNATLSVLRFLDVVTLLSPPEYGYERCFFFGGGTGGVAERSLDGSDESCNVFVPLVEQVASLWTSDTRTADDTFKPPLRLEAGKPVLVGGNVDPIDAEFIGRYATGLTVRNSMPKMKAAEANRSVICDEFESEFLMGTYQMTN